MRMLNQLVGLCVLLVRLAAGIFCAFAGIVVLSWTYWDTAWGICRVLFP